MGQAQAFNLGDHQCGTKITHIQINCPCRDFTSHQFPYPPPFGHAPRTLAPSGSRHAWEGPNSANTAATGIPDRCGKLRHLAVKRCFVVILKFYKIQHLRFVRSSARPTRHAARADAPSHRPLPPMLTVPCALKAFIKTSTRISARSVQTTSASSASQTSRSPHRRSSSSGFCSRYSSCRR